MKKEYSPHIIEPYVQKIWNTENTFKVTETCQKEKFYCLAMIPYPSGKLHMGHVRNYTISDVIARFQRMLGKNVLHPIGWDAFGLPAENAAIKNNIQPSKWTYENIKYMKKQLKLLGFSYDWSREITTCKPEYYKWEQWFFIELYNKNLIYKKKSWVNWCEHDQTVLANEQVINESCWRCNNKITKKKISQWFIKITKYAKELLNDLKNLPNWPKKVKIMQANWIGRSHGVQITVKLTDNINKLKVFTSRPDILMGVTFISIALSHKLTLEITKTHKHIQKAIRTITNTNITNNNFTKNFGINTNKFAFHPITQQKIPIWITNHIIPSDNCENKATFCVPAHNQNDLDFAIKHNLDVKPVILKTDNKIPIIHKIATTNIGKLFNSGKYNNLTNKEGANRIVQYLKSQNIGKKITCYQLKDWGISRQRYWGTPIPMATLKNNNIIPVPKKHLPIILPENIDLKNTTSSLKNTIMHNRTIKINGELAKCEPDTCDTFLESSWYYARFTCTKFENGMIDKNLANYWLPVDQYIGGIEHAVMHLMYFRFVHKVLRDLGLVDSDEPVKKLLCQGMVLSDAFYYFNSKKQKEWISSKSIEIEYDKNSNIKPWFYFNNQKIFHAGMMKMSKSKNNGVEPEDIIKKYGADTIRLFIMFSAPIESELEWKESGVKGIYKFLKKLWALSYNHIKKYKKEIKININQLTLKQKILRSNLYETIQIVSQNMSKTQSFNTAISKIIQFINKLNLVSYNDIQDQALMQESLLAVIKMLYPFIPHFSFSIWKYLSKNKENIDFSPWPKIIPEAILSKSENIIVIQINGKKRHTVLFLNNTSKENIVDTILKEKKVKKYIGNKSIKKIIYIPNKIINLVI